MSAQSMGRGIRIGVIALFVLGAGKAHAVQGVSSGTTRGFFLEPDYTLTDRFWLKIEEKGGYNPIALKGGALSFGYQGQYLGVDLLGAFALANYGSIGATTDGTDPANPWNAFTPPTPGTELARTRSSTDPWTILSVQSGLSVAGRLFSEWMPLVTEKARLGAGFGMFNDSLHALTFYGWLVSYEAEVQYRLGQNSPWSVILSGSFQSGRMTDSAGGTLPFNWVGVSAGLVYWF